MENPTVTFRFRTAEEKQEFLKKFNRIQAEAQLAKGSKVTQTEVLQLMIARYK